MKINGSFFTINNHNIGIKQAYPVFKSCDLLDLSEKDIFEKIQQSVNYENFLGNGTEAEVYRIKGTDYCVRIPYVFI